MIDETEAELARLREENARMAKVVEAAREGLEDFEPGWIRDQQAVDRAAESHGKLRAALAELDKWREE